MATHITEIYEVDVTQRDDNGNDIFLTACLDFNYDDIPGNLRIVTFGSVVPTETFLLVWRHQDLDTKLNRYQAVRKSSDVSDDPSSRNFMIFGGFKGALVGGQGVSDSGDGIAAVTFEFLGSENATCAPPK